MKHLLDSKQFSQTMASMGKDIIADWKASGASPKEVALIGIRTRGVPLASRLSEAIKKEAGVIIPIGILDITLYRDDLSKLADHPLMKKTEITFPIDDKLVYLVDDVLYTGRTVRCALDALFDFGRPKGVRLVVMVERHGRELPIQADVSGLKYDSKPGDNVKVKLKECDGADAVDVIL